MHHLDGRGAAHFPSNLMAMHNSCDPMENHSYRMWCTIEAAAVLNDVMAKKDLQSNC